LVHLERLAAYPYGQTEPQPLGRQKAFDIENVDRELCLRVISTALTSQSGGNEAAARYLNEGLPTGTPGLTRHHVLRAFDACRKAWRRSPCTDRWVYVFVDHDRLCALNVVYKQSREAPELRKYRGEELAWRIHERFDLNEYVHRASLIAEVIRAGA
jgi:hypothetical protein